MADRGRRVAGVRCAMEMLKNSLPGIFQLAVARYTPARRSVNQGRMPLTHAGASCPGREALNKSAFPYRSSHQVVGAAAAPGRNTAISQ